MKYNLIVSINYSYKNSICYLVPSYMITKNILKSNCTIEKKKIVSNLQYKNITTFYGENFKIPKECDIEKVLKIIE